MPLNPHANASRSALHEAKRIKPPVNAASTANVSLSTPGATMDGVTLSSGNRVLLKNQTTASQNGIYVWTGAAAALTRATDASAATDFLSGDQVYVLAGTVNAGTRWTFTTTGAITIGSTSLTYNSDIASAPAFGASGGSHSSGLVPDPGSSSGTTRFLREDASFAAIFSQSSTAAALATSGTISTSGVTEARVSPTAAVASVILQAGTYGGQEVWVVNEAVTANSITFATAATSHVAGGTGIILQGGVSQLFVWDAGTSLWYCEQPVTPAIRSGGGTLVIDGGGQAITSGVKLDVEVPYNMTLSSNRIVADQSGSIVIDILRAAFGSFPGSATSICASARPTLSSQQTSQDTTLSGWTTTLLQGDWLRINVVSASTVQRVSLALSGTRT